MSTWRAVTLASMALCGALCSCSSAPEPGEVELEARGDFAGCVATAIHNASTRTISGGASAYYIAGQCSEVLGDRASAINYYQTSVNMYTSPGDNTPKRLEELRNGGALLTAAEVERKSAAILAMGEDDERRRQAQLASEAEAEHPAQASENAALLGAMASQMTHGSNYQRQPNYVQPASSQELPTPVAVKPVATLRYANQCVALSTWRGPGLPGDGIYVDNRCGADITVWLREPGGLDFRNVRANSGSNWTTLLRHVDYACFIEAGDQICEK